MKPVNNMSYYDFVNPQFIFDKEKLNGEIMDIRYLKDIVNTNTAMFDYDNLPNNQKDSKLTSSIIEQALTFRNRLCIYNSPVLGTDLFTYVPSNTFDTHMKPISVDIVAFNGVTVATNVQYNDIVIVKDNTLDIPPIFTIMRYVKHMEIMETTIDRQMIWLRLPACFTAPDKNMVASFNKLIQKALGLNADDNSIAIVDDTLAKGFSQYDIKFPVSPADIIEMYKNYKNFTLESIGIKGSQTQKKERLLVGEVQSTSDFVNTIYDDRLQCRKNWIEECNKKFNTNIVLIERYKDRVREENKLNAEFSSNNGIERSFENRPDNSDSNDNE